MDLGIILGDVPTTTDARAHLDLLLAQVEAAQRAGIRYITIGQHFLYGEHRWLQPIPTLARLAAEVSSDTRLVTTVLVLPLYHPVALAEDLATLDIVSAGRLVVGVGLGYRRKEFDNLGITFDDRVPRFEEGLELIKRLWTEPHVEHHGTYFDVDGEPHLRPWQQPRPPLWIGAQSAPGVRRAARLGDAWPIGPRLPIADIRRLQRVYAEERSRLGLTVGPQPLRRDVSIGSGREEALQRFLDRAVGRYHAYAANERSAVRDTESVEESIASHLVFGTMEQCVDTIRSIDDEIPVDPVIVRPSWPGMDPASVVAEIDRLGELAAALG